MTQLKVTRAEYLRDLANTQIELDAYKDIAAACRRLAALPENAGANRRNYLFQSEAYEVKARDCGKFLEKLKAIDKEDLLP